MLYWHHLILAVVPLVSCTEVVEDGVFHLTNGTTHNCGELEVYHSGQWNTVCSSSSLDKALLDFACSQLDFVHGAIQWSLEEIDSGSSEGLVWTTGVLECPPTAITPSDCHHRGPGEHNCTQAVQLCCDQRPSSLPVRLTCPPCTDLSACKACPSKFHPSSSDCQPQHAVTGIVEVMVNGVWGPISDEGWDVNEATVVCGQLGYPILYPWGGAPPIIEEVWPGYNQLLELDLLGSGAVNLSILLDECQLAHLQELDQLSYKLSHSLLQGVQCSGTESRLVDCSMTGVGSQPNPSRRAAAVRCGFRRHTNCLTSAQKVNYINITIYYSSENILEKLVIIIRHSG